MKPTVRSGFVIALVFLMVACREDKYRLQTNVRTSGDGRSYLTIEVFRGNERVFLHSDLEMVPGNGGGSESQRDQDPKVRAYAEFDKEGRGALVTMQVRNDQKVLAQTTQFVERPIPAGYVRAGIWNGVMPPVTIDRFHPLFPDRRRGVVFVEARINTRGTVDSVVVLNPGANRDDLDRVAAEAVREWRFKLATRDGQPIAVAAMQLVDFGWPKYAHPGADPARATGEGKKR